MTPQFSRYLDIIRFLAALMVYISHFAYPRFTDGHYIAVRELNLGSDAVVFFFVLSGLVIAYTNENKDKTLKKYSFNRLTRLYSVIVPALLLTLLLDQLGQLLAPEKYQGWWYYPAPVGQQLFKGLSLSNEWLGQSFRIGTNGPYWSLSYEAAYYILFGVAFYFRSIIRMVLLLLCMPLFGVPILALLPNWVLGVWVYRRIKAKTLPYSSAWLWMLLPPIVYVFFLFVGLPKLLMAVMHYGLGEAFVSSTLHFSDEFIWNFIIANLIACHLLGVAAFTQKNIDSHHYLFTDKVSSIIRWWAGSTFTVYVTHYPLLQFIDALLPDISMLWLRHTVLFITVLIFCFLFAEISERRLHLLRKKLLINR